MALQILPSKYVLDNLYKNFTSYRLFLNETGTEQRLYGFKKIVLPEPVGSRASIPHTDLLRNTLVTSS